MELGLEDSQRQLQERKDAVDTSVSLSNSTSNPSTTTAVITTKTNKFIIRKIKYSKQVAKKLEELVKSDNNNNNTSNQCRNPAIRRLIGTKCCCICATIPEVELWYNHDGANVVERYCNNCYKKRKQNELESKELCNNYFVKVDSVARFLHPLGPHPTSRWT
jgi:hypothetical protein